VRGKGFIDPQVGEPDETRYRFRNFALAFVEKKTGIEEDYRNACVRDLKRWIFPTFGECDVRSTEHFSSDTVAAWVRMLEQAKVHKGQKPKKGEPKWRRMSPKTIRNLHGLLSSIIDRAVKAEPPLRTRNPCEMTHLPRTDDDGADGGEDTEFLTPDEVEGLIANMERRSDQLLATIKYGTGMRWSEVTALAPECLVAWGSARPVIRVKRAWKRDGNGGYYIGMPKSRRGRRSIRVSPAVVEAVDELGGEDRENPERLYFTGEQGQRLHYSTFYGRWLRAVQRAKEKDLLPVYKTPTAHDLRHSHAAVLISEGRGLTYVQRRLGHESIQTTSDTYGHLLPDADDEAMDVIDRSLGRNRPGGPTRSAVPRKVVGTTVHVVVLPGGHTEGFWNADRARLLAEMWKFENSEAACIEPWPAHQWERRHTDGLDAVRSQMPDRVRLWSLGPAVYGHDGAEQATASGAHELRDRWVWEWETGYTTASADSYAEYRPAPSTQTEAAAWGVDQGQVRRAYVKARAKALRICGQHPALDAGEDAGAGGAALHIDS
jgi:integrase